MHKAIYYPTSEFLVEKNWFNLIEIISSKNDFEKPKKKKLKTLKYDLID